MRFETQILAVFLLLAFCGAVCAADVNGPIAHWKFDEGSGTVAHDSAGVNDGYIIDAKWFDDPYRGMCLRFDGDGDYVNIGNTVTHSLEKGSFTAWVFPDDLSSICGPHNFAYIVGADTYSGGALGMRVNGDGGGWASVKNTVYLGHLNFPTGAISVGDWYYVAMTWDGSHWKLYLNGVEQESKSFSEGTSSSSNTALIAKGWDGCSWDGKIDDVRIYNQALSAGEVRELYLGGLSAYERAIINIEGAIAEKTEAMEKVDAAIAKEQVARQALQEMWKSDDCGDLSRRDIIRVLMKVNQAIQSEKQSLHFLDKSVERLEGSLTDLGWDPNLIAHWKFDEGSGDIAYDSAGDNDGTLVNGPSWTSGKIKGALSFDDANGYVTAGSPATLDDLPLNNMTVCAWIRDEVSSGYPWRAIASCYAYNHGWSFRTVCDANGARSLNFEAPHSGGQYYKWAKFQSSYGAIIPHTWHHVAAVWDVNTKTAKLYIDSTETSYQMTNPGVGAYNSDASRDKEIGRIPHVGGGQYFRGKIDDVRIYSTALPAEEIRRIYREGKCRRRCTGR